MDIDPASIFSLASAALVTAAVFSWLNYRFIGLPTTIGVMLIALGMSLALHLLAVVGFDVETPVRDLLERIEFSESLLQVMLAFLLFAGALHVDLERLRSQKWVIGILATAGVVASTAIVGACTVALSGLLELGLGPVQCLLFGALISPTDPIAVLGILKTAGVPKSLETKITGESLFNDGIGVVVFMVILQIAAGAPDASHGAAAVHGAADAAAHTLGALDVAKLFVVEVGGALALGLVCGWIAYRMIKTVDGYQVEVLITLALCMGLYSLASALHASGPLAVVVAGLFIGNSGRTYGMSAQTTEHVDRFWELIDEILNVVLFVLIGAEVLVIRLTGSALAAGLLAIPFVLGARLVAVGGAVALLSRFRSFTRGVVPLLTWAGLRGGISVALALSIPASVAGREVILTMTYVVVVFSIVVQGLTVAPLARRLIAGAATGPHA
jgi:CPA1 family monovalent cation:H+ antiporter